MKPFHILILLLVSLSLDVQAQGPRGSAFGFGLVLGEPVGGTVKYWTSSENALQADIGGSWYGSPRIDVDYLWHFDAFRSHVIRMYAGPGIVLGFGDYNNDGWFHRSEDYRVRYQHGSVAVGMRAMIGINIVPARTPLEIFLGAGPVISISPGFYSGFDLALGVRFYP